MRDLCTRSHRSRAESARSVVGRCSALVQLAAAASCAAAEGSAWPTARGTAPGERGSEVPARLCMRWSSSEGRIVLLRFRKSARSRNRAQLGRSLRQCRTEYTADSAQLVTRDHQSRPATRTAQHAADRRAINHSRPTRLEETDPRSRPLRRRARTKACVRSPA